MANILQTLPQYKLVQETDVVVDTGIPTNPDAGTPLTAAGQIPATGGKCLGIAMYDFTGGDRVNLLVIGEAEVVASGAIAVGADVAFAGNANGGLNPQFKTANGTTDIVLGRAKTVANGAGDHLTVVFRCV